jgi:hypothetical protein
MNLQRCTDYRIDVAMDDPGRRRETGKSVLPYIYIAVSTAALY